MMDMYNSVKEFFSYENIMQWMQSYRTFGPLLAFFLPFIEAFLPFLPFSLFVIVNVSAYGLFWGFTISCSAAILGSLCVFWIVRKFGQTRFLHFLTNHKHVRKVMDWIDEHGFGPIFILLVMPFTPSSAVNVVAGLSEIRFFQFLMALIGGKVIKVFAISYIGYDLRDMIEHPVKLLVLVIIVVILWFVGKRLERWMSSKKTGGHNEHS